MKKNIIRIFVLLFIYTITSCKSVNKENNKNTGEYYLEISVEGIENTTAYLKSINPSSPFLDSTTVRNGKLIFKGKVNAPARYVVTIDSVFGGKLVILENDSIFIKVDQLNLVDGVISNSKINDELIAFQSKSSKIFKQIELFFPDLQRARLDNDLKELNRISKEMDAIIEDNTAYNFQYCLENPNSYISAMILNDLSKRDTINTIEISETYNELNDIVKQSIDGKELERRLVH